MIHEASEDVPNVWEFRWIFHEFFHVSKLQASRDAL